MNNTTEDDYAFLGNPTKVWQTIPKAFIKQLDTQKEEE